LKFGLGGIEIKYDATSIVMALLSLGKASRRFAKEKIPSNRSHVAFELRLHCPQYLSVVKEFVSYKASARSGYFCPIIEPKPAVGDFLFNFSFLVFSIASNFLFVQNGQARPKFQAGFT